MLMILIFVFLCFNYDFIYRCFLCEANSALNVYENILFSFWYGKKSMITDHNEDEETLYSNLNYLKYLKISQEEFLLTSQFEY